jgi:hypothetical protein
MTPKEKAEELIKKHLTVIAEESMDSNGIMLHIAKQCALVTVNVILESRPGFPYPDEVGLNVRGIFNIIHYPDKYWREVYEEIIKYDGKAQ